MRKVKKWMAAALGLVMCAGLAACGGKDFDAAGYTKSVMDANYHGEYAEYAKFRDLSEDEAKKEIEDVIDSQVEAAFAGQALSDEAKANYKTAILNVMKQAKYEVGEAKEGEDGNFTVSVKVEPVNIFDGATAASEEIATEYAADGKDLTDMDVMMEVLVKAFDQAIEEKEYAEPVTVEVKVTKNGDNMYGIEEAEMSNLESTMFPGI